MKNSLKVIQKHLQQIWVIDLSFSLFLFQKLFAYFCMNHFKPMHIFVFFISSRCYTISYISLTFCSTHSGIQLGEALIKIGEAQLVYSI